MLSLFPDILFLAPFSALLLRISLGFVIGYVGWTHFSHEDNVVRVFGILESAVALTLIAGVWTQGASLAALAIILLYFSVPRFRTVALGTALLSLAISLSLLVTGAGAMAFDLPL